MASSYIEYFNFLGKNIIHYYNKFRIFTINVLIIF